MSLFGDTDFLLVYKQWGMFVAEGLSYADIVYPIAFKNNVYLIQVTDVYYQDVTTGPGEILCIIQPKTTNTKCRVVTSRDNPGSFYGFLVGK